LATRGIREGFHQETRKVSELTSGVAELKDRWTRGEPLKVHGASTVSEIFQELSALIGNDSVEFARFGVQIEVQDREDAKR
jgi:hypothetical protein